MPIGQIDVAYNPDNRCELRLADKTRAAFEEKQLV
jgi:hypothetical protein